MTDADYMSRALFHAARGLGRTSPNPVVGAVIVSRDGVVVGEGYHARAGESHAEINALDKAGTNARGATLYCSLEPCCHTGRTGPCAARIADAGVARVVASVKDPNPLVDGRGIAYLRSRGISVEVGLAQSEAVRLNQPFFTLMRTRRPFVTLKAAISQDGCIAESPGRRTALTSAAANRHAHRFRAEVDAIGVGLGTLLADDPLLTARGAYRERPLTRVVFDRALRTPPGAALLSTRGAGPVMLMGAPPAGEGYWARRRALEAAGAEVVETDGTIGGALDALGQRDVSSLLLEGGAALHEAAWLEGTVNALRLYVTPPTFGPRGLKFLNGRRWSMSELRDTRIETLGPDVLVEGYVHGPR